MRRNNLTNLLPITCISLFILTFLILIPGLYYHGNSNFNSIDNYLNESEEQKISKDTLAFSGGDTAKIFDSKNNNIIEINYQEYLKGVVASEMPVSFDYEALKAQAVAARTFYFSRRMKNCPNSHGGEICNTTHCQVYMSKEDCLNKWNEKDRTSNWEKISMAVEETKDIVLTYEGELVLYPQFFATSSGKTENAVDVFANSIPYLVSTDSEGEEVAPKYTSEVSMVIKEFVDKINNKYANAKLDKGKIKDQIIIESYTEGGSVDKIKLGNISISGRDFRTLFNLNSSNFKLEYNNTNVIINCKGYGHGVGMSQWGANVMSKEGKSYEDILKHYYTGVDLGKVVFN